MLSKINLSLTANSVLLNKSQRQLAVRSNADNGDTFVRKSDDKTAFKGRYDSSLIDYSQAAEMAERQADGFDLREQQEEAAELRGKASEYRAKASELKAMDDENSSFSRTEPDFRKRTFGYK